MADLLLLETGDYLLLETADRLLLDVAVSYTIVADAASYSLSGTDATLTAGSNNKVIIAAPGIYALAGQDVAFVPPPVLALPIRGEWPEQKKRQRRHDSRQEAMVAARAARDALRDSLARLYDGGEYDAPVEVLEKAQSEAQATVNALTKLADVPLGQLRAAEELIINIQELLRQRQLDDMQTEAATKIAQVHLIETIDIAAQLYHDTRYNYLARMALLLAE